MPKIVDKINLGCHECGELFAVQPSKLKAKYPPKYCSRSCAAKNRTGENSPTWKGGDVERSCGNCDEPFYVKAKIIRAGGGKYCSPKCYHLANAQIRKEEQVNRLVEKQCLACGNPTFTRPSRAETYGIYCSSECRNTHMGERRRGENNPRYKHGLFVQENVNRYYNDLRKRSCLVKTHTTAEWKKLKLDYNHTCPSCGKPEPDIKLEKDHVVPLSKGGHSGIDNIQPLCRSCNLEKNTAEIRFEPYQRP